MNLNRLKKEQIILDGMNKLSMYYFKTFGITDSSDII